MPNGYCHFETMCAFGLAWFALAIGWLAWG